MSFFQEGPVLGNQYLEDSLLRSVLSRLLPPEILAEALPDLVRLGERAVTDLPRMAADAERNAPRLVSFDPWGRRVDRIEVAEGWKRLEAAAAEEGLVAEGYERRHGPLSRVVQFAKLYLYTPSSAIFTCPLAMTDGAARLIEVHGDADLKGRILPHLVSRDPASFWTSGQWMTERTGGSDVGTSETVARRDGDGWRLFGDKWFTSAATSPMAMTLARIEDEGKSTPGSRGLSLFYLETAGPDGGPNGILVHRLKDKLGTKALPTAELTLDGTTARLVGVPGAGVKQISTLFNVTRIYNAISAVSLMRRGIALTRDWAKRRRAFGKRLHEHPLFLETVAGMEVELHAAFHLTFHLVSLMGKVECGAATEEEGAEMRLLTPLAKLSTAKQGVGVASEVLESFGGAGYVEDTGLPVLLRDAQVLAIWEGTTDVLSLDALRAIRKEKALEPLLSGILGRVSGVRSDRLASGVAAVRNAVANLQAHARRMGGDGDLAEASARSLALGLSRVTAASLLLRHADWCEVRGENPRAALVAARWCSRPLADLVDAGAGHRGESRALAMGEEAR
jgi:alkylation response protein AidB-like acyl-CoA dehydrogenase